MSQRRVSSNQGSLQAMPGFLFIHSQILIVYLLLLGTFLCAGDLAVNEIVKNLFEESNKLQVSELQQILESGKCCEKI